MNLSTGATLDSVLFIGYSEVLAQVRRGVKGLRIQYLFAIVTIGQNSGCRCFEISELINKRRSSITNRFNTAIKAGFVYKQDKRYYLTESGAKVYAAINEGFKPIRKQIIDTLTTEARKHL